MNPIYSKWYNKNSKVSATGINLTGNSLNDIETSYRDLLRFNKQSLVFYLDCIPYFYEYILKCGLVLKKSYSMLDIGTRTGIGANFFGQVFSDELWGYQVRLKVDTIDINKDWNDYLKLMPFINSFSNRNLFDLEDNSYDICFCSNTIEHLENPLEFVKKANRVARKFSMFYCPYNEINPIKGHYTISGEFIKKCNPKYVKYIKSANKWYQELEFVLFVPGDLIEY